MEPVLSAANTAGVASLFVASIAVMSFGAMILRDWRGIGSSFHRVTMRSPLSGNGLYRDFRTFQVVVGSAALTFGLFALVVVAAAVA